MKASELEFVLLGALLAAEEPAALLDACSWSAQQLFDPRVRVAWEQVRAKVSRRQKVDAFTVWSAGKGAQQLRDEDLPWLQSLQAAAPIPRESFLQLAEDMRRQVAGRGVIEQMRKIAEHINRHGLNPSYIAGALDAVAHELARDHAPDKTAAAGLLELIAEPDLREKTGALLCVQSGLKVLDEQIGGFVPNLNMILGDPSVGKNSVVASMVLAQARAGLRLGVFALEEGDRFLSRRHLAKLLGIPVRSVARAKWTPEQQEKLASPEVAELYQALDHVQTYEHDGVTADELIRRATSWVLKYGVQCIYVDHIGEVRHRVREGESFNWAVADSYRRIRDFAKRYSVPVVMLAHRKPEVVGKPGPPSPSDVGLTGEAQKMVRLMLGLWKRRQSLRCSVVKFNEGPDDKPTVELERIFEAALVEPDKGQLVSIEKEAREAREEKKLQAWEEQKVLTLRREKWNAERKTSKPPEPEKAPPASPPQLELLPGGKDEEKKP